MRALWTFLLLAAPLWAQSPIPRYDVTRATEAIVLDGKLDDKAWAAAGPVEFVFPWDSQTGAKQRTQVRILWDDTRLYVGYWCDDADVVALHGERDDPTYRDDAVEIFINPRPSQTDAYFGLEMNARAVLYDYLMVSATHIFKRFNFEGVQLASFIDGTLNARGDEDRGWSLEVAVPWVNFEELAKPPSAGTVWRAALNRWDGVAPYRRLSMWSNPLIARPSPHVPERFGELVFAQPAE